LVTDEVIGGKEKIAPVFRGCLGLEAIEKAPQRRGYITLFRLMQCLFSCN
jgi:hypothetical protein